MTNDLVGVWHLVSFQDLDEDGGVREGPLGPRPRGLLIYTGDGYLAVSMMRTEGSADGTSAPRYMGYAGCWRIEGGRVVHLVSVTPNPDWVDVEQVRDVELNGEHLTLYGTAVIAGRPQRRVLNWQRGRTPERPRRSRPSRQDKKGS
ncbi:lipocalin-like domain-containing protein [Longimycelium tulufanense]|uniref:lipocalin-like domain-containing protein n=1 Tax=Longimycelium tulufanense TaxID=907463 RepID=UPI001E390D6C|nr:lipocalin-like domain-containing protein [Longimycelium tulufanense]